MKKMAKHLTLIVTVVMMFLSLSMTAQAEKDQDRSEVQAYASYYSEKLEAKYPQATHAMVDLNGDNILEYLLLVPSGARSRIILYTYSAKKVKLVKNFGASTNLEGYNPKTGKFVISTADGYANTTYTVYTLKGKTLKKQYYYKSKFNYKTNTVKYYKNTKQITEKSFVKAITNFGNWSHPKWEAQPVSQQ